MAVSKSRPVLFFDIDNCLYPRSKKVHELMIDLINKFFASHLSLSPKDAHLLHQRYYTEYGLAIEGLVRHHKVDPLEYNRQVDDALPLDGVIVPDPQLRQLLEDIDTSKIRLWLFTNAHVTHGLRVVKLLGVNDLFEGITYCDYTQDRLICKPHSEMFDKAEAEADVRRSEDCFFVDDSHLNCTHAQARGWTTVHLLDPDGPDADPDPDQDPQDRASIKHQIRDLQDLRNIFPQFFKPSSDVIPSAATPPPPQSQSRSSQL